jgi:hypothetical protein
MFSIRSGSLFVVMGLLACAGIGCVARGVHPAPLNNTPLPPDQAIMLRDWPQQTAYYPNGAAVSGPTDFHYEVKQGEPEWTYYYADLGTWALNMVLLPYYLIVEPQWTEAVSHGEVVPVTYTGQPPLPPQMSPGYVPKPIRAPAPSTVSKSTRPATGTAPATKMMFPPTTRPVTSSTTTTARK